MQKLKELGKELTKKEMKELKGGSGNCTTWHDCSCGAIPEPEFGQICVNGLCKTVGMGFCP